MEENRQTNREIPSRDVSSYNPDKRSQGTKNVTKRYFLVFWDFLKVLIVASAIVLPIRYFIFQPFIVKGESMAPNFHSGDYLIIDEISYRFSNPKRGDVVVLKYPLDIKQRFIKRIVGLPGETVDIKNGKVTISKEGTRLTLEERYVADNSVTENNLQFALKDNQYFVLGDNRHFSYDSRGWGPLPREYIIGKTFLRIFPISKLSYLGQPAY